MCRLAGASPAQGSEQDEYKLGLLEVDPWHFPHRSARASGPRRARTCPAPDHEGEALGPERPRARAGQNRLHKRHLAQTRIRVVTGYS
jgi:hypothetical protein